jgi:ABC-type antimicrobial peptide transport system permease subunit
VLRLSVITQEESIAKDKSILSTGALSTLTTFLGGLALLLATIGIYGVTAWSVVQRTREIGIRMALGAQHRDVLSLVLRHGMKLVLLGMVVGLPLALAVTQLMKSFLFGLPPIDPITFTVVPALLTSVGLIACYIPARRATKVDPLVALRYE